jgi:alkanesulfonate monooxygenase SsuD/methylene tetrahydromethanopterin reductase-like flavin-dependent oxidoreductase (luciferase family)
MRLGYFSMPMHPADRPWQETLAEDRAAVILADRLGYHDAFIGEHLTDRMETITSSMVFLATLISDTSRIKLATGTSNLSHQHPVVVAAQAAMFDHLAGGRFILGVSPGALQTDAEALGLLGEDRAAIFAEAMDAITGIWAGEAPYDLPGERFPVTTRTTMNPELNIGYLPKPLQQPRPEMVGTVLAPYSNTATVLGRRDVHMLSGNFLLPQWVATHWPKYVAGQEEAGLRADPADWRIARTIFVADTHEEAVEYALRNPASPYRAYYAQMMDKMRPLGRMELFKTDRSMPDEAVTLDGAVDELVIAGTPDEVAERILAFREQVGDFGELVYAGMDWVDERLARRSLELMAEKVMPAVNEALR